MVKCPMALHHSVQGNRLMILGDSLTRWEIGEMEDEKEIIELFQHLVDTGMVWELQGYYGRVAMAMLEEGTIKLPEEGAKGSRSSSKASNDEGATKTKKKARRRSKKQIGALVKMANRKVAGFGIILDRVEMEERDNETIRKLKAKAPIHWGVAGNKSHKNLVLIEWFEPPSEYSDYAIKTARQWYPDKWVRVISPAGKRNEKSEKENQSKKLAGG